MKDDRMPRCPWTGTDGPLIRYHDQEWGVPVHDDRKWFELLLLDGFQAGLSWKIVLHKREGFRAVFHGFDPVRVARMSREEIDCACRNPAIVRNRRKIEAAVKNAGSFIGVQRRAGSFDEWIWSFTGGEVVQNAWGSPEQVPAATPLSDALSRGLKDAGFSFVGSTICYAFLQAGGIVNDHLTSCFRHRELSFR